MRPWLRYAAVSALYKLTGTDVIALRDEIARLRYQLDETMVENAKLALENTRLNAELTRIRETRGWFRGILGSTGRN